MCVFQDFCPKIKLLLSLLAEKQVLILTLLHLTTVGESRCYFLKGRVPLWSWESRCKKELSVGHSLALPSFPLLTGLTSSSLLPRVAWYVSPATECSPFCCQRGVFSRALCFCLTLQTTFNRNCTLHLFYRPLQSLAKLSQHTAEF